MKQISVCTANSTIFTMGYYVLKFLTGLPLNSLVVYNPIFRWYPRHVKVLNVKIGRICRVSLDELCSPECHSPDFAHRHAHIHI